jgi:hypothetical protein
MAPRAAYVAVRGHQAEVTELTESPPHRPYFDSDEARYPRCPYCEATKGKLACFDVIRLAGGRVTTAARKTLLESLPKTEGHFAVIEVKASRRDLLFEWLGDLGRRLDFDQPGWLIQAAQLYLEKRFPAVDWVPVFAGASQVRRSSLLEEGWEREGNRLYLAPSLYDEVLLMQYLVSRSHKSGGQTFEGRLIFSDLMKRLSRRGFLREREISEEDPFDLLDSLVDSLDPGAASTKVLYVIDRRDFLEKTKRVYAHYA